MCDYMDYDKFLKEWDTFKEWESKDNDGLCGSSGEDIIFLGDYKNKSKKEDSVDHPFHYTQSRTEAIDVIEDAIKEAPNSKAAFLQGQVLKYMLRLWLKIDAKEDAEKARWYLNRLIDSL